MPSLNALARRLPSRAHRARAIALPTFSHALVEQMEFRRRGAREGRDIFGATVVVEWGIQYAALHVPCLCCMSTVLAQYKAPEAAHSSPK